MLSWCNRSLNLRYYVFHQHEIKQDTGLACFSLCDSLLSVNTETRQPETQEDSFLFNSTNNRDEMDMPKITNRVVCLH